jgi:hypothetical protein
MGGKFFTVIVKVSEAESVPLSVAVTVRDFEPT